MEPALTSQNFELYEIVLLSNALNQIKDLNIYAFERLKHIQKNNVFKKNMFT